MQHIFIEFVMHNLIKIFVLKNNLKYRFLYNNTRAVQLWSKNGSCWELLSNLSWLVSYQIWRIHSSLYYIIFLIFLIIITIYLYVSYCMFGLDLQLLIRRLVIKSWKRDGIKRKGKNLHGVFVNKRHKMAR